MLPDQSFLFIIGQSRKDRVSINEGFQFGSLVVKFGFFINHSLLVWWYGIHFVMLFPRMPPRIGILWGARLFKGDLNTSFGLHTAV